MNGKTPDYISLKPIAERFKEVAKTISNDEIKNIIKDELREQVKNQVELGTTIRDWVDEWLEDNDNYDFVMKCIKDSVSSKFSK